MYFWYWKIIVPVGILIALSGMQLSKKWRFYGQTIALTGCIIAVFGALWHAADVQIYATDSERTEMRYLSLEYEVLGETLNDFIGEASKAGVVLLTGEKSDGLCARALRRTLSSHITLTQYPVDGRSAAVVQELRTVLNSIDKALIIVLAVDIPSDFSWEECAGLMSGRRFVLVNPLRLDESGVDDLWRSCMGDKATSGQLLFVVNRKADVTYDRHFPSSKKAAFSRRFWLKTAPAK